MDEPICPCSSDCRRDIGTPGRAVYLTLMGGQREQRCNLFHIPLKLVSTKCRLFGRPASYDLDSLIPRSRHKAVFLQIVPFNRHDFGRVFVPLLHRKALSPEVSA